MFSSTRRNPNILFDGARAKALPVVLGVALAFPALSQNPPLPPSSSSFSSAPALRGIVRDDEGRPLPGVTVELRLGPGVALTAFTDPAGRYVFASAPPGTADLAFRLPGFATLVRKRVVLGAGATTTSDAVLHLTTSTDVVVTGKRTFRNLADLDTPVNDLIGVASASTVGVVTAEQIDERETHRPADILESVPGFLISQHSGEGKANQYYLRGFNLDHGRTSPRRSRACPSTCRRTRTARATRTATS